MTTHQWLFLLYFIVTAVLIGIAHAFNKDCEATGAPDLPGVGCVIPFWPVLVLLLPFAALVAVASKIATYFIRRSK